MADVTKIPGPMPQEPSRESREVKPGTDKFKELMKIDKSGEREKKKKKRQEESEEETKAALQAGPSTSEKVSETKKPQEFPKVQKVGESEKRQSMAQKRAEEAEETAAAEVNQKKIEAFNLEQIESAELEKKGATPSYAGQIEQKEAVEEKIEAIEEKEREETAQIRKQVKKEEAAPASPAAAPAASALGPLFIAPAPQVAPAYTQLSSEMLALYEKMVSQIFIMQASGINETTIHLNTPEFAHSMFAGAQIVIKEYSTAPLAFNIEFLGSPQNSLYFEQNIGSLRAAFAAEDRKYSIHRIDSRLLQKEEKPHFRRKEKPSKKNEEDST